MKYDVAKKCIIVLVVSIYLVLGTVSAYAYGCPIKPAEVPPIIPSCRGMPIQVCVCDSYGRCTWVWACPDR